MPAVLDRPIPNLNKLREAVRIRTRIVQLERKLTQLFGPSAKVRNSYGFSAHEMDRLGMRLHARAKKQMDGGKSKTLIGSINDVL